jgi:acetylornithine deacetylase
MDVPADSQIIRLLGSAVKEESGSVVIETAQYATDAGIYNVAGIPTVVFGPGDIAQAHTASEFIEISQVVTAEAIIRRILTS